MTREALKAHCLNQIEMCKTWAIGKGEEPSGTIYEEHKLILELLEQEPRKGHWKLVQRGESIDVCCSNCEAVRVKKFAYNYTIDQLDKKDVKKCFESDDMRYCPYCGSDNREVEE
jgi:hypothetical protein